jgi:hypothetical protein
MTGLYAFDATKNVPAMGAVVDAGALLDEIIYNGYDDYANDRLEAILENAAAIKLCSDYLAITQPDLDSTLANIKNVVFAGSADSARQDVNALLADTRARTRTRHEASQASQAKLGLAGTLSEVFAAGASGNPSAQGLAQMASS